MKLARSLDRQPNGGFVLVLPHRRRPTPTASADPVDNRRQNGEVRIETAQNCPIHV